MEFIFAVVQFIPDTFKFIKKWWIFRRPAGKIFGSIIDKKNTLNIFVKDLDVPNNTFDNPKLFSKEGGIQQINPNISKVWPEVEGEGLAELFNLLGRIDKRDNINIIPTSQGLSNWSDNLIVLGAQAIKSLEFYKTMNNVGYRMDDKEIYDNDTGEIIPRENDDQYGYGLIIKAKNPHSKSKKSFGFLLGGFGTLGTRASIYYFTHNIDKLGKAYGDKCFSLVIRARTVSGYKSAEVMEKYTKTF